MESISLLQNEINTRDKDCDDGSLSFWHQSCLLFLVVEVMRRGESKALTGCNVWWWYTLQYRILLFVSSCLMYDCARQSPGRNSQDGFDELSALKRRLSTLHSPSNSRRRVVSTSDQKRIIPQRRHVRRNGDCTSSTLKYSGRWFLR